MSQSNKRKKTTITAKQKQEICLKKLAVPTPTNKDLALEYSVGESTIHDILKEKTRWLAPETIKSKKGILPNFLTDGTPTLLTTVTTNISTNSSTISTVSTNSTRESSTINYENQSTTIFHNSVIATNNEGATTLHKSSTTNINNMTTMIQNNIITINQH
ncbi:13063_t:CDS:2, partial [Cetraspora pellucida]